MTTAVILYPAFLQVFITFALCLWMGKHRFAELKKGTVKVSEVSARTAKWKDQTIRVELSFYNQFQVPILFYAACLFAVVFEQVNTVTVILAWVFVACRIVQIHSHTVTNNTKLRFHSYFLGFIAVVGMWGYILVQNIAAF